MNRTEKESAVADLNKTFKTSTSVLLINFEGVNVSAQSELRREVAKVESGYQVIKNRLALRAVEDTSLADLREHFQGPTAIAYTGGDPVALAKVLKDFIGDHPSVAFKAGVVEGKTFSASEVERLAKMPSRPELLSKLVYLLNAPLVRLATALQSPLRGLASVLKQLEEKKQAEAPAEAETKEQEAAAPEPEAQEEKAEVPEPEVQEAAAEGTAEEPATEEAAAEEPVVEAPAAEEPAVEEPVAEESAEAEAAAEEEAGEEKENDKQE